ncbi:MAG: HEAT repeat domain-containing protein [Acidobacteria bacterium]|nr:HEAT repeat domain-containing protein [Acidobacteriota bacterium]
MISPALLVALVLAVPAAGGDELSRGPDRPAAGYAGQAHDSAVAMVSLAEVAAYRYGQSREPLTRLSERVRDSLADPSARLEMERLLIQLLASDATVEAREFACRQLRRIGSAAAVPALSQLLDDSSLGDMALFALASIPDEEATEALSAALETSRGRLRIGLVDALAMRGVKDPAFARLAEDDAPETAGVAIWALGRTGDLDDARRILASSASSPEAREAVLAIAERSGAGGEPVFRRLLAPSEAATVRVAALRGIVDLRGRAALPDLEAALQSDVSALQAEAIRLAASGDGAGLLIEATPGLGPAARRRALVALGEARVSRALPLMVAALEAEDGGERAAALTGIGALGGAEHVLLLAERAAATTGPEQAAARAALATLRGAGVDEALVVEMERASGGTKRELIRAAGRRDAVGTTAALLAAAASSDPDVRSEALGALREMAPATAAAPLAGLLRDATGAAERREAEDALAALLRRHPGVSLDPVVAAFDTATTPDARAGLLSAVGRSGRDDALPLLRRALASDDATLPRTAVRALTGWPTPAPAPDLLAVARGEAEEPLPVLALRGYIRLVSAPSALAPEEVAARLAIALDAAEQPEERKAVLAALQRHACPESLALARTLLEDPEVASEAALAVESLEDALSYRR